MMKRRYLLPLLFCMLSTFAGQVFASTCFFTKDNITLPNFWTTNDLIGPVGMNEVQPIVNPHEYDEAVFIFGSQSVINCTGGGNDNAVTLTAPADASIVDSHTMNGMTLLKTTVPGIVYSYILRCTANCANNARLNLPLPSPGQSITSPELDGSYSDSGNRWDILVTLYQTPEYRPHPGQTTVAAIPGTIGTIHMGPSVYYDSKTMSLNITSSSVLFRLQEPTCATVGINGMSGNHTVDFGDIHTSDIERGGIYSESEFTFDLFNCSLNDIKITVNGPNDGTGDYLVNNSGTAEGVGIGLKVNFSNSWSPVKVDGSASVGKAFTGNTDWYQDQLSIPFLGQLRKIGTLKAGDFSSTATFTLTYE